MTLRRPQVVTALVFILATFASIAPHLTILVYQAVGATPPAGLLLFCPLHHAFGVVHHAAPPSFQLSARPLAAPPT